MEIVKFNKPAMKTPQFEITMQWNEKIGLLTIAGILSKEDIVLVNGEEITIQFDEKGLAAIEFEASEPSILYTVKIKTPEKSDQSMAFFY